MSLARLETNEGNKRNGVKTDVIDHHRPIGTLPWVTMWSPFAESTASLARAYLDNWVDASHQIDDISQHVVDLSENPFTRLTKVSAERKNREIAEQEIRDKYMTPEDAIRIFIEAKYQSHRTPENPNPDPLELYFPEACMYPEELGKALETVAKAGGDFIGNVRSAHLDGNTDWAYVPQLTAKPAFLGPKYKKDHAAEKGLVDFTPSSLYDYAKMLHNNRLGPDKDRGIDTALLQVSEPFVGKDGEYYVSYGVGGILTATVVDSILKRKHDPTISSDASIVAKVCTEVPQTNLVIAVSDIDCLVGQKVDGEIIPFDQALPEHKPAVQDDISKAIGRNAVKQMPHDNGEIATIQTGIGALSEGVTNAIIEDPDIIEVKVHSELATDSIVDLIKAGKIDTIKNRIKVGFGSGTKAGFYDFIAEHPELWDFLPGDFINDTDEISSIPNFFAFNSIMGCDFNGALYASSINGVVYGGEGGQRNFAEGAIKSEGGKFIALFKSSRTDKQTGELVSNILPEYPSGEYSTETASQSNILCTEWGAVDILGKTLSERTISMISIAHPLLRPKLVEDLLDRPHFSGTLTEQEKQKLQDRVKKEKEAYEWTVDTFGNEICGDRDDIQKQVIQLIGKRDKVEQKALMEQAFEVGVFNNIMLVTRPKEGVVYSSLN